jgi:hypothetical protein
LHTATTVPAQKIKRYFFYFNVLQDFCRKPGKNRAHCGGAVKMPAGTKRRNLKGAGGDNVAGYLLLCQRYIELNPIRLMSCMPPWG